MDNRDDKVGEALKAQRFKMLEDIAKELAGDVIFPTYFDASFHLREVLQKPDLSAEALIDAASLEPLIAAKLLRKANSSAYRGKEAKVSEINAAVHRLGAEKARTIALSVAVSQLMHSKDVQPFIDQTRKLWMHSLGTAVAARILARDHTNINPDTAMLTGLLHDLGAFYMLYRASQYEELRARPDSIKYLIIQWHESIGITLLQALGLPPPVIDATVDHDQPRPLQATLRTLADVIYVANILAGEQFEWAYHNVNPPPDATLIRQRFAPVVEEMARVTREMHSFLAT